MAPVPGRGTSRKLLSWPAEGRAPGATPPGRAPVAGRGLLPMPLTGGRVPPTPGAGRLAPTDGLGRGVAFGRAAGWAAGLGRLIEGERPTEGDGRDIPPPPPKPPPPPPRPPPPPPRAQSSAPTTTDSPKTTTRIQKARCIITPVRKFEELDRRRYSVLPHRRHSRTTITASIFGSSSPPAVRSTVCQVK